MTPAPDQAVPTSWTTYAEKQPETAKLYRWRLPHNRLGGLVVEFAAQMRMRGAGYTQVLSPEFDRWDGYHVHVPKGAEWTEGASSETRPAIVGLSPRSCARCEQVPTITGTERAYGGGVIGPNYPHTWNAWRLHCCEWSRTPDFEDPRVLIAEWNARNAVEPAAAPGAFSWDDACRRIADDPSVSLTAYEVQELVRGAAPGASETPLVDGLTPEEHDAVTRSIAIERYSDTDAVNTPQFKRLQNYIQQHATAEPVEIAITLARALGYLQGLAALKASARSAPVDAEKLRADLDERTRRVADLEAMIRSGLVAGRKRVDEELVAHGYDSMEFACVRAGWHASVFAFRDAGLGAEADAACRIGAEEDTHRHDLFQEQAEKLKAAEAEMDRLHAKNVELADKLREASARTAPVDQCEGGECSHGFDAGGGEHLHECEKHAAPPSAERILTQATDEQIEACVSDVIEWGRTFGIGFNEDAARKHMLSKLRKHFPARSCAAVVMPKQRVENVGYFNVGWNECIAEFRRLNPAPSTASASESEEK